MTEFLTGEHAVNDQAYPTGETALHLACRLGDICAVHHLMDLGASPYQATFDGCLPVHFLCMFPPEAMETAVFLLFRGSYGSSLHDVIAKGADAKSIILCTEEPRSKWFAIAKGTKNAYLSRVASKPRYLDRQLPLQLVGTPLAFAVAVASQQAVEILLHLGSGINFSNGSEQIDSRNYSEIHLATSLHSVAILDLLLLEADRAPASQRGQDFYLDLNRAVGRKQELDGIIESTWGSLAKASPIERRFIHGQHTEQAMGDLIIVLQKRHNYEMITRALISSCMEMGDVTVANAGLPISQPMSIENKTLLMLLCTKAACSGAFSIPQCYELVGFALRHGASLDWGFESWKTQRPINIAIEFHRQEILDWFIQNGASLNMDDQQGFFPLHYLISGGFSKTYSLKKLLDAGAKPNARISQNAENGHTALQLAIINNNPEDVSLLLDGGADPTLLCVGAGEILSSALHLAVQIGSLEIIRLLLSVKPQEAVSSAKESFNSSQKVTLLEQSDGAGNTPFLLAAEKGDISIVSFLLDVGAGISLEVQLLDQKNEAGATPLLVAVYKGYASLVNLFLEKGADTSALNNSAQNCLHIAAKTMDSNVLALLVERNDVNSTIRESRLTSLHIASLALREKPGLAAECCSVLLNAGANPSLEDDHGYTSLHYIASSYARMDCERQHQVRRPLLELMVQKGIDLDHPSTKSISSAPCMIHQAIDNCDDVFVQDLLELGASTDVLDKNGDTPLGRCIILGQSCELTSLKAICKVADLLITNGADTEAVNRSNKKLLERAVLSGNKHIVQLLLKHFNKGAALVAPNLSTSSEPRLEKSGTRKPRNSLLLGKFKDILKSKEPSEEDQLNCKMMEEQRLRTLVSIDRDIVLGGWKIAVQQEFWNCVSAFFDCNLHGNTDCLQYPIGIGLLKHALEEDISSVLTLFMGVRQHSINGILVEAREPDPILWNVWTRVSNLSEKKRIHHTGTRTTGRVAQLIKAKGFTPLLNLASLQEKGYVEGGIEVREESLKEACDMEVTTGTAPPAIALFDEEDEEEVGYDKGDEEVQEQLNSLLGSWRGRISGL